MDQRTTDVPLISVVMCTYNARTFIEQAVGSITAQTYPNWELIISDDGSTDGTRQWLQELTDPRVKLFLQNKNLGYVANKNFAHQQATGVFITQMDNDDDCPPDRLEKQYAVVRAMPEVKIVAAGYNRIDESGGVYDTVQIADERFVNEFNGRYPFWFPVLLVHRDVFRTVGFFDEYFAGVYGDDVYWTVRANERFPIYCLREVLYGYRNNPHSIVNVMTNSRKLIMTDVLEELFRQRKKEGADWLEKGETRKLQEFERGLFCNKKLMAERYRTWAAKHVDLRDLKKAKTLLKSAFRMNPFSLSNLRTLIYLMRTSSAKSN